MSLLKILKLDFFLLTILCWQNLIGLVSVLILYSTIALSVNRSTLWWKHEYRCAKYSWRKYNTRRAVLCLAVVGVIMMNSFREKLRHTPQAISPSLSCGPLNFLHTNSFTCIAWGDGSSGGFSSSSSSSHFDFLIFF